MKRAIRTSAILVLLVGLPGIGVGARSASNTCGIDKGNKTYEVPGNVYNGQQFVNAVGDGRITKVELLVDDRNPTGVVWIGIYTSTPVLLMKSLGYMAVVDGWVSFDRLDIPVSGGMHYWVGFNLQSTNGIRGVKKGEFGSYSVAHPYNEEPYSASSNDMPPFGTISSVEYVIRITVSP